MKNPTKQTRLTRFSEHFGINRPQSQLDFVDIPLDTDIKLYVDPYALHVSNVDWLRTCGDLITNFFDHLISTLRAKNRAEVITLLSNLHEPNETRLGESRGTPNGRGWGKTQAGQLYAELANSSLLKSESPLSLAEFEILVPGIGSDKISDLAINIIRGELVDYTQEQCSLYGIPTSNVPAGVYWNPDHKRWEGHYADLPIYKDKGLILVPKVAVRRRLVPDGEEYYSHHVLPFLQAEHLAAKDSLVHVLKNGTPKVYIADLRAKYKYSKEFLFSFSKNNPSILNAYKKTLPEKAAGLIGNDAIESRHAHLRPSDRRLNALDLKAVPVGKQDAIKYQDFVLAAFNEIFYPSLTRGKKEYAADEGRKRIDIVFHNSATSGFFSRLAHTHHYYVPYIHIECKNYTGDPGNPEFGQLEGRLNRRRGFFGILMCRTITHKALMLRRCRDLVSSDDKKVILVLEDSDLTKILTWSNQHMQREIDEYLEDKLKEILF